MNWVNNEVLKALQKQSLKQIKMRLRRRKLHKREPQQESAGLA